MHDVFYFTDIHGRLELFNTIRKWCLEQDEDCTIIYGGDAIDRGPDGYTIMKELLEDPRIVYLYGNHEDLFIQAADAIIGRYSANDELYNYLHSCDENRAKSIIHTMNGIYNEAVRSHLFNGGESTLIGWLLDGADEEIVDKIRDLPRTFKYENLDFSHAGGSIEAFEEVYNAEYNGKPRDIFYERELIWDREHFAYGWANDRICIHGHTPTIYLPKSIYGNDLSEKNIHPCCWGEKLGAKDKRGGLKIDMDTGITFIGRAFVLNCLTMNVTRFDAPSIRTGIANSPITVEETYNIIKED